MVELEDLEKVFETLVEFERKHTRAYYSEIEAISRAVTTKDAEDMLKWCLIKQAHIISLQFAQGQILDLVKRKDLYEDSSIKKLNWTQRRWRKTQHLKSQKVNNY